MTDLFTAAPPAPALANDSALPGAEFVTSIIDNDAQNTLRNRLRVIGDESRDVSIASAFFSLNALAMLADLLAPMERIRLLFGDDADYSERRKLLALLRTRSDTDLQHERADDPTLAPLKKVAALFAAGKIEVRCYVQKKFHAKAYLFRYNGYRSPSGVIGSGNFTASGLTRNIELNVKLSDEQCGHLATWYEDRWNEARNDVVTDDLLAEIRRQIDLYSPYALFLQALYAWGDGTQDTSATPAENLQNVLDPHQEIAFRQSLRLLELHGGVMICDGVGLGKSFVALALMQHFLMQNKTVLLVAPQSILKSSWHGYLHKYLRAYRGRFPRMHHEAMTWFGFDPDAPLGANKARELEELSERADLVVVDESHNFRTPSSLRYKNLHTLSAPQADRRKKIVLMTATPVNTEYADLAAQVALITHDEGNISGLGVRQINAAAKSLDKAARDAKKGLTPAQPSLDFVRGIAAQSDGAVLNTVLESLVIQRSRRTCIALAALAGKQLLFPERGTPQAVRYDFGGESSAFGALVELSDKLFRPGINLLKALQKAEEEAKARNKKYDPMKLIAKVKDGIKLTAFSLDQFLRSQEDRSDKRDKDELRLASLVFINALKQLESSPVAFQGIVQSLATGLIARLQVVCPAEARDAIERHGEWARVPLFTVTAQESVPPETPETPDEDAATDAVIKAGEDAEKAGDETDEWLERALRVRKLGDKLAGFTRATHDVDRWAQDIFADLDHLRDIYHATAAARTNAPDPKLAKVEELLTKAVASGKRVLLFTQSQRTAVYLERELRNRGTVGAVARVDSHITDDLRGAILHSFCPGYNPPQTAPSVPERVDVLISTDVLAEGVNLQQAELIVNYDIHWNPVRLIQRIGRVDRRLDPAVTKEGHKFGIENVVPPLAIERIIELVGRIEERTVKISETMGIAEAFLSGDGEYRPLRELNAEVEGESTATDDALGRYLSLRTVDPPPAALRELVAQLPPGAFGVWDGAERDGVFAHFQVVAKPGATDADRKRFAAVLSRPHFALWYDGDAAPERDAPRILTILGKIAPAAKSANPSPDAHLRTRLKNVMLAVRNGFGTIRLPASLTVSLVSWMELRRAA